MNLTICSPQLGIAPESNSGGEVYDREVLHHLSNLGIKSLILLPKNRSYSPNKNFQINFAAIKPMFPPYIFNFFVLPYLNTIYKRKGFDILRIHNPYFVGPAAIFFKRNHPKIPVIASYLHLEQNNILQNFIDKLIINKFDHIITISEFTKKEIIEKYEISSSKITVIYPGIDKKFKPLNKDRKLINKFKLNHKKTLLFLGGLKKRKNPLFLLDLIRRIKDERIILLVAGDGSLKNEMMLRCKKFRLQSKVVFAGFVKEEEKTDYYNLADVVLLPSLKEGFGMIAAEAGACGKTVIASANSSLLEVIYNKKTGFLAKTNNCKDWLRKINELVNNQDLREKTGAVASKYIRKKFSWENNANKHLEIFKRLLKNK